MAEKNLSPEYLNVGRELVAFVKGVVDHTKHRPYNDGVFPEHPTEMMVLVPLSIGDEAISTSAAYRHGWICAMMF